MKTRVYLRIAKNRNSRGGCIVKASNKPNFESLNNGYGKNYPTIQVALDLDIADKEFDAARILLESKIESSQAAIEIKEVPKTETQQ